MYIDNVVGGIRIDLEMKTIMVIDAHGNRQMQCYHGIAIVYGLEGLGIATRVAISLGIPCVAGIFRDNRKLKGLVAIDGQM